MSVAICPFRSDLRAASTRCYCTIAAGLLPSSPRGFSTDLDFKVSALAELRCVSSDKLKKKISHVSSIPAALRGFLFAIQLFLILPVVLLFAGEIIILSRRRAISLLSRAVSDGSKKSPSHKARRVGRKGISRPLAAVRFGKCLPFGQSKRLEGRGHAARAAVSVC